MAVINVDDIYILDNTGKQVDDAVDYGLFNSNGNLLDNWYFVGGGSQLGDGVFPINQRGQTSYSGNRTTIDRWKCNDPVGVLSLSASGMSITVGTQFCGYQQYLPMGALVEGETYTLSIKINGTVYSWTIPSLSTAGQSQYEGWFGNSNIYSYIGVLNGNWRIMPFDSANGTTATVSGIQAIKLEKGAVSTLANDAPPNYWQELEKCQHYLWIASFPGGSILSTGYASGDYFITDIILPTTIRESNLTLTFNANVLIIGNGAAVVAASVIGVTRHGNHLRTYINPASALTNQNLYAFVTSAETVMAVSAEP